MTVIPFAEFLPDMPDLSDATDIALNVIARTPESYAPVSGLSAYSSNALPAPCLGMAPSQNVDDSIYLFAGTASNLYQMSSGAWSAISLSGGYNTVQGDCWRFAQFKSFMLATNYADPIQSFTMGSSTAFATLSSGAPQARFIAVAKNFCIVANTYDSVGGANPARLWWSANGDPTNWPVPGSSAAQQVQSDYNDMNGPMGDITGLAPNLNGCDCAVFFDRGVFRMIYVGPPDVFDFFPAQSVRGTRASNSIVTLGNMVYYLAEDGFYAFDGNMSMPIGTNKVDKWFFSQLNQAFLYNVIGTWDVINKAVFWIFPSQASTSGVPDTMLIYRWDIARWSWAAIPAQWIAPSLSFTVTMDSTPALGNSDIDTLPFSLDSRVWIGGVPQVACADPTGYLAFFNGTNLQAQIGTKAAQITPGGLSFVSGVRPLVSAGSATVAVSARQNYFDPEIFGADVALNSMGDCPQRSVGRYHRARVTIPAGASWSQALGVDVTAIPAGVR